MSDERILTKVATGQTIASRTSGGPGGVPVVLIHGLSGDMESYPDVVSHLLRLPFGEKLQFVTVDLRGHGHSTWAASDGYTIASYAADLRSLLERLSLSKAVIVGHSLGGMAALSLTQSDPEAVRALFLEDPPLFSGGRGPDPAISWFQRNLTAIRELRSRDAPVAVYEALVGPTDSDVERARRANALYRLDTATLEAAINGTMWVGFEPSAPVTCPMTVLQADPFMGAGFKPGDAARLLAADPHARVIQVVGAGHVIRDPPTYEAYLNELDRFLEEVLEGT